MRIIWNVLGLFFFLFCIGYILTSPKAPAALKGLFYVTLFWFIMYAVFSAGKK